MGWANKSSRMFRLVAGLSVSGGAVTAWMLYEKNKTKSDKLLASWTTNFKPTVKWDDNWDR